MTHLNDRLTLYAVVLQVSIVPRGDKFAYAMFLPREQYLYSKEQVKCKSNMNQIATFMLVLTSSLTMYSSELYVVIYLKVSVSASYRIDVHFL